MRFSDLFLQAVEKQGVSMCFGIAGAEAEAITFNGTSLPFYLTRHEFSAGIMADVAGRLLGRPQMCWSTFGPGLTNMSTGACSAILDRSPVLIASPQVVRPDTMFNLTHQCIDNIRFMEPLTKARHQFHSADDISTELPRLMEATVSDLPGPTYASIPLDVLLSDVPDAHAAKLLADLARPSRSDPPQPRLKDMEEACDLLQRARSPLLLIGNQVIRDGAETCVHQFVKRTGVPVVCTLAAKGVIPEDHPLFLTAINKYVDLIYGENVLEDIFSGVDLLIMFGYDFGEDVKPSLWGGNIPTLVLNSVDVQRPHTFKPTALCVGDFHTSISYLHGGSNRFGLTERQARAKALLDRRAPRLCDASATDVGGVIKALGDALGHKGILCSDIGLHKQYAGILAKTYAPNRFLCSNVCGSFGFGLPAAMAAKLCLPDERVAVICGDGGFHSVSHDLETVARYRIPIVIVLLNDSAFGLIQYYQRRGGRATNSAHMVSFGDVDFCALARANGVDATRVTDLTDLQRTIDTAFQSSAPHLIEIPTKYDSIFSSA